MTTGETAVHAIGSSGILMISIPGRVSRGVCQIGAQLPLDVNQLLMYFTWFNDEKGADEAFERGDVGQF